MSLHANYIEFYRFADILRRRDQFFFVYHQMQHKIVMLKRKIERTNFKVRIVRNLNLQGKGRTVSWSSKAQQSLYNREKIFNNVILIGSCNNTRSLAAVVGRCPALGVTVKALLGELPQVLFFHWHWGTSGHMKNTCVFINPHSITEELA